MIIWKGWGILVPVIWVASYMILRNIFMSFWIDNYWIARIMSWLLYLVPSVLIWFIGRKFNERRNEVYLDEVSGETFRLGSLHTLFFIPFEYWAIIGFILSIWFEWY